jgi:histidinol dehydrogenase
LKIIQYSDIEDNFFASTTYLTEDPSVRAIVSYVLENKDRALMEYTLQYEGVQLQDMKVTSDEIKKASAEVDNNTIETLKKAKSNIEKFSKAQLDQFNNFEVEIVPGVLAGQKVIPLARVGIYVPGGRFPLVSTLLMCTVPAKIAGVEEIAICSPPSHKGTIHPAILAAADLVGINEIYKVGGAQAIAAMAYGTETIKRVDKIIGPGSKYVTLAKKEVFGPVGIDFIAGPSEIMIIADDTANPRVLTADILAQAEHDTNATCILITDSPNVAEKVNEEVKVQLKELKNEVVARQSLNMNGMIIITNTIDEAVDLANRRAPEHLELQIKNPDYYVERLKNYGSLFIGEYSAETLGDYSSGLNHTLPTNGGARYTGGLGVKDFLKLQTTLRVTKQGLCEIGPIARAFGEMEGLDGHAKSISIRLDR